MLEQYLQGLLIGGGVSVVSLVLFRLAPRVGSSVSEPNPAHIGESARVVRLDVPAGFGKVSGQVRVRGENWRAVFEGAAPKEEELVEVVRREGLTLVCRSSDAVAELPVNTEASDRIPARVFIGIGRTEAGVLCFVLLLFAAFGAALVPSTIGFALVGLFTPLACATGLVFADGFRSTDQPGLSVTSLRVVLAVTLGFGAFVATSVSGWAAVLPFVAAGVLLVFDPFLIEVIAVVGAMLGAGDG